MDALLESPEWNPEGRELPAELHSELERVMEDYRFFARTAVDRRFRENVLPELDRLRSSGAYLELPVTEAPPVLEEATITHGEPSDRKGFVRIYYFHEADYPDLYYKRRVAVERSLEAYVRAYQIINGSD